MKEQALYESFWLSTIPGIGPVSVEKLLEAAGDVEKVKDLPRDRILACLGSKRGQLLEQALEEKTRHAARMRLMQIREQQILYLPRWHPAFPGRLGSIPDPPLMLFIKGRLPAEETKTAALIGARACSAYGAQMARYFAERLSCSGVTVISGMARGVDSIAQEAALRSGQSSVAVLGCGVDICYPPENRRLYDRLVHEGALVSEYLPGTRPQPGLFPPRNRIISGLSDLVLVIEAREKSGTLITVDMALEQGRDVYAVPGRIQDVCSRGCNRLIANGAGIAADAECILEVLQQTGVSTMLSPEKNTREKRPLTDRVLAVLGTEAMSMDDIATRMQAEDRLPEVMQELLYLNMEGTVLMQGGRYFKNI